jgi:hypothetical protein
MDEHSRTSAIRAQYIQEFLFSLNVAFLAVAARSMAAAWLPWVGKIQLSLNHHWRLPPESSVGGDFALSSIAFVLALCIFVIVRLLSIVSVAGVLLLWITGIVSLVALPAWWLYFSRQFPVPANLPNLASTWLFLEIAASMLCTVLYLWRKWPLPGWGSTLLLILHFVFWGWLFLGGPFFWLAPFKLVFPAMGLAAMVAWGIYVSRRRALADV